MQATHLSFQGSSDVSGDRCSPQARVAWELQAVPVMVAVLFRGGGLRGQWGHQDTRGSFLIIDGW